MPRCRCLSRALSLFMILLTVPCIHGEEKSPSRDFSALIEADWERQEKRAGRAINDRAAIRAAYERGVRLLEDLARGEESLDLTRKRAALEGLKPRLESMETLDDHGRRALYRQIRWLNRAIALANPLLGTHPLVFLKRRRFTCQMLHEYLGYYYDYADIAGGGVSLLEEPGRSMKVRDLIGSRLPGGNYTTLTLSYDARTLYFAFAERAVEKPDYYSAERRCFHIYSMKSTGTGLRQLTRGPEDDFDPCPLPDGGIAFMSTRRGGFGRCHNPWEPLPTYTLHRMDTTGTNIRALSYHETNEWHPAVLADGRLIYSRWDYVDRSAANFHGLWVTNPDGTGTMALFGNYTTRINACFQPRSIPGSHRIVFVAGAHHASVGGSLVLVDPARVALDARTGEDSFAALEVLTPEVCFPEAPGWPGSYFHSPWPLSENYYLVSFSFDPLPGMGPGVKEDTETGLYLFDRFGNLELLYREPGISCMYPIPLAPRPVPAVMVSAREQMLGDEAEVILLDVKQSHLPMPPSRPVRALRIFQVLPKSETHMANRPRLGYANAESARLLLGTVPVEADGSAYFRVPARKPLYFQAVDDTGRAVQGMRSVVYFQPGETRSCIGCHEGPGASPPARPAQALQRPPSTITAGPDGSHPWSYPRLVQPVLEARCVRCHDGSDSEGSFPPDLTARPRKSFTASYENLKPHVRWYEWGGGIGGHVTRPGHMPADKSPLTRLLDDDNHANTTGLTDSERHRIYLWLDGNASFYGTYDESTRRAQQQGVSVAVPAMQ